MLLPNAYEVSKAPKPLYYPFNSALKGFSLSKQLHPCCDSVITFVVLFSEIGKDEDGAECGGGDPPNLGYVTSKCLLDI